MTGALDRSGGVSIAVVSGLFLASLALRPQLLALGPLLPFIRDDLGLPASLAGLLTTIPVLCMGIFAPLGPRMTARLGPRWALAVCLGLIAGLGMVRAVAPTYLLVLIATFGIGVAIGAAGAIPSMLVSQRLASRPALGMGAYAGGIVLGSTLAAAFAVPLAAGGDWRASLLIISAVAWLSLAAWLLLVRGEGSGPPLTGTRRLPWRSTTAWLLVVVFGLQSILFYGVVAWLPNVVVERGWTATDAGALVAIFNGIGLLTTIGVPLVADQFPSRRPGLVASAGVSTVGFVALAVAPGLAYPSVVALGLALGAIFPLVLTLPIDVTDDPVRAGSVAALMLLGGYILSSLGPFALGAARDLTGDFGASLWLLVGVSITLVGACLLLSPARLHRGVERPSVVLPMTGFRSGAEANTHPE